MTNGNGKRALSSRYAFRCDRRPSSARWENMPSVVRRKCECVVIGPNGASFKCNKCVHVSESPSPPTRLLLHVGPSFSPLLRENDFSPWKFDWIFSVCRIGISRESIHSFVRDRNEMKRRTDGRTTNASPPPPTIIVDRQKSRTRQPLRIAEFGDYETAMDPLLLFS